MAFQPGNRKKPKKAGRFCLAAMPRPLLALESVPRSQRLLRLGAAEPPRSVRSEAGHRRCMPRCCHPGFLPPRSRPEQVLLYTAPAAGVLTGYGGIPPLNAGKPKKIERQMRQLNHECSGRREE